MDLNLECQKCECKPFYYCVQCESIDLQRKVYATKAPVLSAYVGVVYTWEKVQCERSSGS